MRKITPRIYIYSALNTQLSCSKFRTDVFPSTDWIYQLRNQMKLTSIWNQ